MNERLKKILLFFLLCIPLRLLLVYLVYKLPNYIFFFKILYFIMALGFLNTFINYKKNSKGAFDGIVWWNNLRILNSICYLLFVIFQNKNSYLFLFPDIIIGVICFIKQYFFN